MPTVFRIFIFLICISLASCMGKKTCSGISPEVGSYDTAKKIRKARRHAHSAPEKAAETHRLKTVKNHKSSKLTKTTGKQGGLLHLGSKHKKGGSSGHKQKTHDGGGGGNVNIGQKN